MTQADNPSPRHRPHRPRLLVPLVLLAIIGVQVLFLWWSRLATPGPEPAAISAEPGAPAIVSVMGNVRIRSALGDRTAQPGDRLRTGDAVLTDTGARTAIEFEDRGSLTLDGSSTLELLPPDPATGRPALYLSSGAAVVNTVEASDTELPIFHTPHATFAPRGDHSAEFLVAVEGAPEFPQP